MVLFYKYGDRKHAIAGYCSVKSSREKEMCLMGTHLFTKDHPLFSGHRSFTFVRQESDYVFEIYPVEIEDFTKQYQALVNEHAWKC
jgi:hypothetical protein